jgi:hypothetical protein
MAKVRLRMFRALVLPHLQVVHQGSYYSPLCPIRLGRWYPPPLQDLCPRIYLVLLRYRLCHGIVFAQLGPRWSIQRCP